MNDQKPDLLAFLKGKILQETYTRPQLIRRIRVLRDFLSFSLYEHPESRQNPIQKQVDDYLALRQVKMPNDNSGFREKDWLASLGQDFYNQVNPELFARFFSELDESMKSAEPVILYIPVELSDRDLAQIGSWFKHNVSVGIILETRMDPNLIGGCALTYQGIYKDFSLRRNIAENHQVILDNLRSLKGEVWWTGKRLATPRRLTTI